MAAKPAKDTIMATKRKQGKSAPSASLMAALAARPQSGGAPVAGIPGGAAVQGLPGGMPMGGMPGGPSAPTAGIGMKKGGNVKKMADGGSTSDSFKDMKYTGTSEMEVPGESVETYRDAKNKEMFFDKNAKVMRPTSTTRMIEQGERVGAGRGGQGGPTAKEMQSVSAPRKYASGGAVSASSRADGIAQRGKTVGKYI
jgi:hypothetical protein